MITNIEEFRLETLKKIRNLDRHYQAIMAGQGHGLDEDETIEEMEKTAQSIGMTLEDAYEYAEDMRNRDEDMAYGYFN